MRRPEEEARTHEPARRLRVGLVGCGGIARQYHLRELAADRRVEIVAIAEPSPQARALVPDVGAEVVPDVSEVIGRENVDALVVTAANPAHAAIADAAADGPQHLYLEKPLAIDLDDARRIEAKLAGRDAIAVVGFQYRLSPAFARLRDAVTERRVGAVRQVRAWHCEAADAASMPEWKRSRASGGGALLDIGSHSVDFARWLLDDEVAEVEECRLSSVHSDQDEAALRLRMEGGAAVDLVCSYLQGRKHRWEVEGEDGVLRAERWPARLSRRRRPSPAGPSRLATSLRAIPIPRREPSFGLALRRFVDAALGASEDLPSVADGRRSLEVVLEAERSAS
jgi:scyllo-inositol 2-dehydrogenase (NAD+)